MAKAVFWTKTQSSLVCKFHSRKWYLSKLRKVAQKSCSLNQLYGGIKIVFRGKIWLLASKVDKQKIYLLKRKVRHSIYIRVLTTLDISNGDWIGGGKVPYKPFWNCFTLWTCKLGLRFDFEIHEIIQIETFAKIILVTNCPTGKSVQ